VSQRPTAETNTIPASRNESLWNAEHLDSNLVSLTFHIPRLVIAGVSSGVGKTTVMVGLSRALRQRGLKVAVFKTGPDYLDPTYHARAADATSHALDGWMMGKQAVLETFASVSQNADIALVEGVMGLFDGASPTSEEGSTAQIAKWLQAPVLLIMNVSGMARTVAAIAQGCAAFDPELCLAGVLCNKVGSRGHLDLLREALTTPPIMGGLPKEPPLSFPERHLGLHSATATAVSESVVDSWAERVTQWCDVDQILSVARSAKDLSLIEPVAEAAPPLSAAGITCRIGYAFDAAFHFYYEDNLRRLRELGAKLVPFSPISDPHLPDVDGLYFGGGYPELYAEALAANISMKQEIVTFAASNGPIYAECGGLMYLSSSIRTTQGCTYPMVDLIQANVTMRDSLQALGYVEVETSHASILGPAGLRFRGHQFRYSELSDLSPELDRVYALHRRRSGSMQPEGYRHGNILASYVHAHWASNPAVASGLVASCVTHAKRSQATYTS
jgi:cobyrinic acid a,c-diamide synthase